VTADYFRLKPKYSHRVAYGPRGFFAQYAKARELQAEAMFEELLSIADEVSVAEVRTSDGMVELKLDATAVARNRLRVDARKWALARMAPRKYGDKVTQELTGDANNPIQHCHTIRFVGVKRGA
jgi:hypothetical protein